METMGVHHWGTDKQNVMQIHNKILFGHKRESNLVLCGRGGIGEHYVKCSSLGKG